MAGHGIQIATAITGWRPHLSWHIGRHRSDVDVGEHAVIEHQDDIGIVSLVGVDEVVSAAARCIPSIALVQDALRNHTWLQEHARLPDGNQAATRHDFIADNPIKERHKTKTW